MRRRFDLTPLGHPAFWGALALLVVNDDLFKGRGAVPGWLTGKLSDFAFLIVAPLVLAALIPRRVPGRRTAAVVAVTALYVAADLSRAVSDAVVGLVARVGLTWRLWPDPSDLVALAVLPVTVWLLRRTARAPDTNTVARRTRVQRERAGIVLGALACLATSAPPIYQHSPFLVNRTAGAADVRITWVVREFDCETITPESLGATLTTNDLDDARPARLESGDVAALDGPPLATTSPVRSCDTGSGLGPFLLPSAEGECRAAILETDGAAPVLMVAPGRWTMDADSSLICPGPPPESQCEPQLDPGRSPGPDAISIVDAAGERRFQLSGGGPGGQLPPSGRIRLGPVDPAAIAARPPAADGCRAIRDAYHALAATTDCASNADCQVLPAVWIPGEPFLCELYVSKGVVPMLQAVGQQWQSSCVDHTDHCAPNPPPAICRLGRCASQNAAPVGVPDAGAGDASVDGDAGADAQSDTAVDARDGAGQ
jgi:hypothetical protein